MQKIRKIISSVLCVLLLCAAVTVSVTAKELTRSEQAHVSFDSNGKLKIFVIADIQDRYPLKDAAKNLIQKAVQKSNPDLILLIGDNIAGYHSSNQKYSEKAIRDVMNTLDAFNIPIAMVFGNHDDEGKSLSRLQQVEIYKTYKNFIGWEGEAIEGSCPNYNIPIYKSADSDQILYNIWMLDSGSYYYDENGNKNGYGFVSQNVLDWYTQKSNQLKEENGGNAVPSMVFQHIVPVQIFDVLKAVPAGTPGAVSKFGKYWILPDNSAEGSILSEGPCSANLDTPGARAEVDTMKAQGDVSAIVFGHDHINSYVVPCDGIDLINCPGCTYDSYNDDNRGFRVFIIDSNDPWSYETYTITQSELNIGDSNKTSSFKQFFVNLWNKIVAFFKRIFGISK